MTCAFRPCDEVETCCLVGGCVVRRFPPPPAPPAAPPPSPAPHEAAEGDEVTDTLRQRTSVLPPPKKESL